MGYFNRGMYFNFLFQKAKSLRSINKEAAIELIDDAINETYGVSILVYHNLSDDDNQYCISPDAFQNQMEYLRNNNYNIIRYDDLKTGNVDYHELNVIVTFDDARKGLLTDGAQILSENDIPYMLFVAPMYQNKYAINGVRDEMSTFLTWKEIEKLMNNTRINIGSHSYNHLDMSKLNVSEIQSELINCDMEIRDKLGIECKDFAFPFGRYGKEAMTEARKIYETVSTTGSGLNFNDKYLLSLRRTIVLKMFNEKNFHDIINFETVREKFVVLKNEILG